MAKLNLPPPLTYLPKKEGLNKALIRETNGE